MSIYIVLYGNLQIYLIQLKKRHIDEHNMNIVNMIDYVAYICNNLFLNFSYTPYPKLSLFSMIKDITSQKPFHPKKINYTQKLCFNIYIMYSM